MDGPGAVMGAGRGESLRLPRSSLGLSGKQRMRSRAQHSVSHIPPGWAGRGAGCRRGEMIPPHTRSSFPFPLLPHPWRRFSREVQMLESPGSCCWTFQNSVKFIIPPGEITPCPFLHLQHNPLDLGFYHRAHKSAAVSQQLIGRK